MSEGEKGGKQAAKLMLLLTPRPPSLPSSLLDHTQDKSLTRFSSTFFPSSPRCRAWPWGPKTARDSQERGHAASKGHQQQSTSVRTTLNS